MLFQNSCDSATCNEIKLHKNISNVEIRSKNKLNTENVYLSLVKSKYMMTLFKCITLCEVTGKLSTVCNFPVKFVPTTLKHN